MPLPAVNDGAAECDRGDRGAADGEMRGVVGGDFRGHHDRDGGDHSKIHYSDITITIKSASDDDDETRPDQVLMTTERPHASQQPTPQPTTTTRTNSPLQTPTFPKEVKKERSSLRKKLVRIELQLFKKLMT